MHASIWRFQGDPDDLLRRYDAALASVPAANMRVHLCLRGQDGIVFIDTCPTAEIFEAFAAGPFRQLLAAHGLPEPERVDDYPVHRALVDGTDRA